MFVIDTNVMSASDPLKDGLTARQKERLSRSDIFLPVVAVSEIKAGFLKLKRIGATSKVAKLDAWWARVELAYAERILPFDLAAAEEAAVLVDRALVSGHDPGWQDIQIAAIAASRGFTVLTRNTRHFAPLGVPYINPFAEDLPD